MSIVVLNVLTVPSEMRDELERRFAGRAGAVESSDGFEHFELLRPAEGTDRYLVYTRWRSHEDFQRWMNSQDFQRGHANADGGQSGQSEQSGQEGQQEQSQARGPAATDSEVWTFEVIQEV